MLKVKKFTIDNRELVQEVNKISKAIEKLELTRADLMDQLLQFEKAAQLLTGKKTKAIKKTSNRADNKVHVETIKAKIPKILTSKPLMMKGIFQKLYEEPGFNWPLSYMYFDHIVRELAEKGAITRKPEGYVKNASANRGNSVPDS
jgi:hypothetical protein